MTWPLPLSSGLPSQPFQTGNTRLRIFASSGAKPSRTFGPLEATPLRRGGAVHAPVAGTLPPQDHSHRRPAAAAALGGGGTHQPRRLPRARAHQAARRGGARGGGGGGAVLAEDLVPRAAAGDGRRVLRARAAAVPRPRPARGGAGAVLCCRPGEHRRGMWLFFAVQLWFCVCGRSGCWINVALWGLGIILLDPLSNKHSLTCGLD
jgi:hypothetical protein